MKEKKVPQRMCVVCRTMRDKKELIRVVRGPDGNYSLDFTGKKNGRGAYLCNSPECVNSCIKKKTLNKAFGCDIGTEVYEKLKKDYELGK